MLVDMRLVVTVSAYGVSLVLDRLRHLVVLVLFIALLLLALLYYTAVIL